MSSSPDSDRQAALDVCSPEVGVYRVSGEVPDAIAGFLGASFRTGRTSNAGLPVEEHGRPSHSATGLSTGVRACVGLSRAMSETPAQFYERVVGSIRRPDLEEWDTWPFQGEMQPRVLDPPASTDVSRVEQGVDCNRCEAPDEQFELFAVPPDRLHAGVLWISASRPAAYRSR